jgi:hypothetical protein
MTDNFNKFIDDEVIRIVKTSTTYKHICRSKDHDKFMDVTIKQWDSVTANILCYLKGKYRKQFIFTQAKLFTIAKLAAVELLKRENKYKDSTDKCLTSNV